MNTTDNNKLEAQLGQSGWGARDALGRWLSDGQPTRADALMLGLANADKLETFVPGARVRVTRDLERYPHFIVEAGAIGTVVDVGDPDVFAVRLDEVVPGAEEWENEVHWSNGDSPHDDLELVDEQPADPNAEYRESVRRTFRAMSPAALEYQSTVVVGGIDREELEAEAASRLGAAITDEDRRRDLERDEQDAAYERVSFPKVELDPDDAAFVAEALEFLAGVDEGENTDRDRLLEVARMLEDRRAVTRADAHGVELARSVGGLPLFDSAFVNLMLDEIEALPAEEQPAAVRAVNDGSSVDDRGAYA